jgi:hypothetical protein
MQRCVLIGIVALVPLPLFAYIRGPEVRVNRLTINGNSYGSGAWEVSSPTVKGPSGYLTYDASGKSEKVKFRMEKGPGTRWSFVETAGFKHTQGLGPSGRKKDYIYEEQTGYTMKIRAAEGPFEGWYLARGHYLGDGPPELILVKDRGDAATVEMLVKTVRIEGHPK